MMKNRYFLVSIGVFLTFLPGGLYILLAEMLDKYSQWTSFLVTILGLFIGLDFVSRHYPDFGWKPFVSLKTVLLSFTILAILTILLDSTFR